MNIHNTFSTSSSRLQSRPKTHPRGAIPLVVIWTICIICGLFAGAIAIPVMSESVEHTVKAVSVAVFVLLGAFIVGQTLILSRRASRTHRSDLSKPDSAISLQKPEH